MYVLYVVCTDSKMFEVAKFLCIFRKAVELFSSSEKSGHEEFSFLATDEVSRMSFFQILIKNFKNAHHKFLEKEKLEVID
jgi:hypothetical protein